MQRHITDTRFFSEEFTGESVKDSYVDSHLSKTFQDAFAGFSWQAPNEYLDNSADRIPEYAIKRRSRRASRPTHLTDSAGKQSNPSSNPVYCLN